MRRAVADWAQAHGEPPATVHQLLQQSPSEVRAWAAARGVPIVPGSAAAPARLAVDVGSDESGDRLAVPGWVDVGAATDKTKVLLEDLRVAVDSIAASGQVERWLDAMATNGLRRWSANNRILAVAQLQIRAAAESRPELLDEIHMMTAKQWRDRHGRWPAKGSRAIYILRPRTRRIVEEDEHGREHSRVVVTGFAPCPVFNVTQTDGPPLPEHPSRPPVGDAPAGVLDGLRGRVAAAGYTYRETEITGCNPAKGTGTQGYTDPTGREVVVDQRLPPLQKAATLAHELGHIHAGHVDAAPGEYQRHRGQMETEAEAAAYLTLRRVGIDRPAADAFAPGYIAGWMAQKGASFQEALDRAVKASDRILEGGWAPGDDQAIDLVVGHATGEVH